MYKLIAIALTGAALASVALAGQVSSPEIDPATAIGALTLLSGAVLVLRARRAR
jgi:hypothetical protein